MSSTKYITQEGDRLDLIAHRAYGDTTDIGRIISANPHLPLTAEIPPGVVVYVPILEPSVPPLSTSLLPPWKR